MRARRWSGVEAAIVADALGAAVADVAFAGPLLARDLARRRGHDQRRRRGRGVLLPLVEAAIATGTPPITPIYTVDAGVHPASACVLVAEGAEYRLAEVAAG